DDPFAQANYLQVVAQRRAMASVRVGLGQAMSPSPLSFSQQRRPRQQKDRAAGLHSANVFSNQQWFFRSVRVRIDGVHRRIWEVLGEFAVFRTTKFGSRARAEVPERSQGVLLQWFVSAREPCLCSGPGRDTRT